MKIKERKILSRRFLGRLNIVETKNKKLYWTNWSDGGRNQQERFFSDLICN